MAVLLNKGQGPELNHHISKYSIFSFSLSFNLSVIPLISVIPIIAQSSSIDQTLHCPLSRYNWNVN